MRVVALLRAINVGGRTVTMARLREIVAGAGFTNVATVIASGNVLLDAPAGDLAATEAAIERALRAALGYEVETLIRTAAEMSALAALDPFATGPDSTRTVHVTFLREPPPASYVERVMSFRSATDDFQVIGREMWWSCAGRTSDSPYSKAKPDRSVIATARNLTTVRKLAALLG